jgi:hypothetical protein
MKISFAKIFKENVILNEYDIDSNLHCVIKDELKLPVVSKKNNSYIFSFGMFSDFDTEIHGKAIKYLFNNDNKLIRTIVDEDEYNFRVTYTFENKENIKHNLNENQMMFLCAILHNLNLKTYLVAMLDVLLENKTINFDDIKTYAKDDKFNMKIFY